MKSVWSEDCSLKKREILSKDIETDVLIIGAGMAGLLIGYMLNESGKM